MYRILGLLSVLAAVQGAYPDYELAEQSTVDRGYRGPPVVPVILPGGYIADTEEVAKAKDLHFNAYAQIATAAKESGYEEPKYSYTGSPRQQAYSAPQQQKYTYSPQQDYSSNYINYNVPRRQQDYNVPSAQYSGQIKGDIGTYTQAKPLLAYQQPTYSSQPRYTGPPVVPVVLPNGYIAETADVEAAKEHHFQLVAKAQAAVARAQERAKSYGYSPAKQDEGQYEEPQQTYTQAYRIAAPIPVAPASSAPRQQYKGPPVIPVILPDGHIADTAEVAAAKISHLQQLLDAAQRSQPQPHNHYPNSR